MVCPVGGIFSDPRSEYVLTHVTMTGPRVIYRRRRQTALVLNDAYLSKSLLQSEDAASAAATALLQRRRRLYSVRLTRCKLKEVSLQFSLSFYAAEIWPALCLDL